MQQKMRRQLSHLIRLTEDLVDVARIAAGKLELQNSPIEVHDLVRNALEVAQPLMDEKGQEILHHIPDSPLWPGPDSRDGQARRRNRLGLGHDHGDDTILIRDLGLRRVDVMR